MGEILLISHSVVMARIASVYILRGECITIHHCLEHMFEDKYWQFEENVWVRVYLRTWIVSLIVIRLPAGATSQA
jgi:hypothetical protein